MSTETLLDIFVPPEGMVGHSAALVAMTATEDFLEDATQRFTGLRPRQRAELGTVLVYLMLDGHKSSSRQEVFPPGRIPALHEFQPRAVDPNSLLHSKVALLAFAPNRTGAPVHLRLAVLTANFTYTSARQQLELVWVIDLPLDGTARVEDRADLAAAGAFVETLLRLRFYHAEQNLPTGDRKLTARLDVLLASASSIKPKNLKPRFIHSLNRSLYDQIQERLRSAINKPRNLLLCGSGFYEGPSRTSGKPRVFQEFDKLLENRKLFTANARRVALVDPAQAGALAAWAKSGTTDGWKIVRPFDVLDHNRQLHAKFLYAGYLRDNRTSNGWLYLGSGNLSKRGLLSSEEKPLQEKNGKKTWNVETGVVIAVNEQLDGETLARRLFWSTETVGDNDWAVGHAGDAPEAQPILEAPPILWATIEQVPTRRLRLLWRENTPTKARANISWTGRDWFQVLRTTDVLLKGDENPTALYVRGESDRKWTVAVVDAAGRVGWQPPRFDTYADALAALLDFPIRPAEATDDDDDSGKKMNKRNAIEREKQQEEKQEKIYALHAAAELLEKVVALQVTLPVSMLDDWLDHLDRMFRASFPEVLIVTWRKHRLDIFAHLREPQLCSPHLTAKQRDRYFEVLDRTARAWGLQ